MLSAAPVPAAPTALDPLLMPRRPAEQQALGLPVTAVRVLILGLCPITAAAAVMLAGCGVRGFTVADDGWVTWADARAGAFDSTEVGRPRDLCTRRRIRAANAEAAPVTWTDDVLTDARPGRVVLRTSRVLPGPGPSLETDAPGDHLGLPETAALVDVLQLSERDGAAAMLTQGGSWHDRPCPGCLGLLAGQAVTAAGRGGALPSAAVRAAGPAHTAWCAGLVVQAVLAAAMDPAPPALAQAQRWLLAAGMPFSTSAPGPQAPAGCALCGT